MAFKYAAFLSYSHHDEPWVAVLRQNLEICLEAIGHTPSSVFLDRTALTPGDSWVRRLQHGLDAAARVILVATPESMASPRVADEWEGLIARHPGWSDGSVLVVRLIDCPLPPFLERLQWVDFVDHDEEKYRQGLRELLGALLGHQDRRHLPHLASEVIFPPPPARPIPADLRRDLVRWIADRLRSKMIRVAIDHALGSSGPSLEAYPSWETAASALIVRYTDKEQPVNGLQQLLDKLASVLEEDLPDEVAALASIRQRLEDLSAVSHSTALERKWLDLLVSEYGGVKHYVEQLKDLDLVGQVHLELELPAEFGVHLGEEAGGSVVSRTLVRQLKDLLALEAGSAEASNSHWLLIGEAGVGKTTLLYELTASLAEYAHSLKDTPSWVPVYESLPELLQRREPLPLRMERRLRRTQEDVQGFAGLVEEWGRNGRLVLLLDRLDEVPQEARDDAEGLIRGLVQRWPRTWIFVASRPIGGWRPDDSFREARLVLSNPTSNAAEDRVDQSAEPVESTISVDSSRISEGHARSEDTAQEELVDPHLASPGSNDGDSEVFSSAAPPPRVFISYSHDSDDHRERVRALAERLRSDGIECRIDLWFGDPPEGWPTWMEDEIEAADFVLVASTGGYRTKSRARSTASGGRGARFESVLIVQEIYDARMINRRFIPVLLADAQPGNILTPLRGVTYYRPDTEVGYEQLYRRLTGQPEYPPPPKGPLRSMPPASPAYEPNRPAEEPIPSSPAAVVGTDFVGERYQRLRDDLITVLERVPGVCIEAIVGDRSGWREALSSQGARGLVEALLDCDVVELLVHMDEVHQTLVKAGGAHRRSSQWIKEIVTRLTPLLLQSRFREVFSSTGERGVLLQLPVATRTFAELAMSGFDGCPSRFTKVDEEDWLDSARRLRLPIAEDGFDFDGQDKLSTFANDLEGRFLRSEERQHAERLRSGSSGDPLEARGWVLRQVDKRFEREARRLPQQGRYYLLYRTHFGVEHPMFLQEISSQMPSVHRVEQTKGDTEDEAEICDSLAALFRRSDEEPEEK